MNHRMSDNEVAGLSLEEAKAELENAVYYAALLIERLEHAGKVSGNGHHAAQAIAAFAGEELKSRWRMTAKDLEDRAAAESHAKARQS